MPNRKYTMQVAKDEFVSIELAANDFVTIRHFGTLTEHCEGTRVDTPIDESITVPAGALSGVKNVVDAWRKLDLRERRERQENSGI